MDGQPSEEKLDAVVMGEGAHPEERPHSLRGKEKTYKIWVRTPNAQVARLLREHQIDRKKKQD